MATNKDKDKLTQFLLSKGIMEKTIQKLVEEDYDLQTFSGLTIDLLRLMNFKMSEIQVLLPLIQESHSHLQSVEVMGSVNEDQSMLGPAKSPLPDLSDTQTDNLDLSSLGNDDEPESDSDEFNTILEPYFSAEELLEKSKYDKQNCVNQLERYVAASASEDCNADIIKPFFVKRKEQADNKKTTVPVAAKRIHSIPLRSSARIRVLSKDASESASSSQTVAQMSPKRPRFEFGNIFASMETPGTSGDQRPHHSKLVLSENREENEASSSTSGSGVRNELNSFFTNERSCTSLETAGMVTTSRIQVLSVHGSSVNETRALVQSSLAEKSILSENNQRTQSSSSSGRNVSNSSAAVGVHSLPENFECIKPDLIKYDVLQILNEKIGTNDKSKETLSRLINNGILTETKERKLIIRVLTRHLYSLHPSDPNATSTKEKESMAKSFIRCFPKYCGPYNENTFPWDHIYCKRSNTGWIVNASRTLQSKNRQRSSKRQKVDDTAVASGDLSELDSEEEEKLSYLLPEQSEWREILDGMKKSFNKREKFRYEAGSISAIHLKYNHLISFKGEVLRQEFRLMRPQHEDMCKAFTNLQKKILDLPEKQPIALTFEDETIRALVLLSQHLPHDIPNRKDGEVPETAAKEGDIIEYVPANTDLKDYLHLKRANANRHVQPYLIGIKSAVSRKLQKHFLVLDEELMECQGSGGSTGGTIRAIDYLLKSYFVYHVSYPYGWRNTLHFLAGCFLKAFEKTPAGRRKDAVTPSERELMILLSQ